MMSAHQTFPSAFQRSRLTFPPLTPREIAVWRFVHVYQVRTGGISPSFFVIGLGTDIPAKSAVSRALDSLESIGLLRRLRNRHRAIEVLVAPPVSQTPEGSPLVFVEPQSVGGRTVFPGSARR